jgi:hypothetical protein
MINVPLRRAVPSVRGRNPSRHDVHVGLQVNNSSNIRTYLDTVQIFELKQALQPWNLLIT